jgi:hypothetical protein
MADLSVRVDGRLFAPSQIGADPMLAAAQALPLLTHNPWAVVAPDGGNINGWYTNKYDISVADPRIVSDAGAPGGDTTIVEIAFNGLDNIDATPAKLWAVFAASKEVYTEWWIKVSANWSSDPAGAGKMHYLWPTAAVGGGNYYSGILCAGTPFGTCASKTTTPLVVGMWIQWTGAAPDNQPYGDFMRMPNVTTTTFLRNQWVKVAFYTKQESTPGSSRDGIIRWWVNDILNGNYPALSTPSADFNLFEFAPYKQDPVAQAEFLWIADTVIRGQ